MEIAEIYTQGRGVSFFFFLRQDQESEIVVSVETNGNYGCKV